MKKKIFILVFFLNLFASLCFANQNIVFLDLDFIFNNSNLGKKILSNLEQINKNINSNINDEQKILIEKENKIKSSKNILSEEEFKKKVAEFNRELNNFNMNKQKLILSFNSNRDLEVNNFIKKINPLIQDYMEKNSIDLVLEKKNMFIGNSKYDITIIILELINKKFD